MEHAEWLQKQIQRPISEFGKVVANILGATYRGLYHLPATSYNHKRTDWINDGCIQVVIRGELATWDGNELTKLLVLCHDEKIRLAIKGASREYLRLIFSKRVSMEDAKDSPICEGHPTIEKQIETIRSGWK